MVTREELQNWLRDSSYKPLIYADRGTTYIFTKIPKTEKFDYLYLQRAYNDIPLERNRDFKYAGVYHKEQGKIYDSFHCFSEYFPDIESTVGLNAMGENVVSSVHKMIEERLGNDKTNLNVLELSEKYLKDLQNYEQYYLEREARGNYLKGISRDSIVFECDYKFVEWKETNLLSYIDNPNDFISKEADRYFLEHQEDMLWTFKRNELLIEKLKELEEQEDGKLVRIRNIMAAAKSVEAKTLRVTVNKDGEEFTFKTDADVLRRDPGTYYPTWNIAASERREFEKLFGRSADYYPEEITKITYGKNIIYSAEPFIEEQGETDNMTMSM